MSEYKLPFNINPILTTYHHLAHPLGIISGNIPDQSVWFPWFAHKYINCEYHEKPHSAFILYSTDRFYINDKIIQQLEFKLDTPMCQKMLGTTESFFIEQIKKALSKGLYIQGIFNERYISAMPAYQKQDYAHDYLVYGYSDRCGGLFAAGYTADGHYKEYIIPYSEYYNSIFQPAYKVLSFRLMRFNEEKTYETNYSVVLRDLNHYLKSTAFRGESCNTTFYGLSAWEKLMDYLSATKYIDIRSTKIFMEHHKLMNMRLEYFAQEGIIESNLSQQYSQTLKDATQTYLLSMKYNLSQKPNTKENCINAIRSVIDFDKTILPRVIAQIEQKTNI